MMRSTPARTAFLRIGKGRALHLDLEGEPTHTLCRLYGARDASMGPYVVVLEHDHGGQVHAVGVDAGHEARILFHETEAEGSFAGGSDAVSFAAARRAARVKCSVTLTCTSSSTGPTGLSSFWHPRRAARASLAKRS